jgi:hypothetical protein
MQGGRKAIVRSYAPSTGSNCLRLGPSGGPTVASASSSLRVYHHAAPTQERLARGIACIDLDAEQDGRYHEVTPAFTRSEGRGVYDRVGENHVVTKILIVHRTAAVARLQRETGRVEGLTVSSIAARLEYRVKRALTRIRASATDIEAYLTLCAMEGVRDEARQGGSRDGGT